jgi:hypothetical protein
MALLNDKGRETADIAAFKATWRIQIPWTLPSDDDLRRVQQAWKQYPIAMVKQAMKAAHKSQATI